MKKPNFWQSVVPLPHLVPALALCTVVALAPALSFGDGAIASSPDDDALTDPLWRLSGYVTPDGSTMAAFAGSPFTWSLALPPESSDGSIDGPSDGSSGGQPTTSDVRAAILAGHDGCVAYRSAALLEPGQVVPHGLPSFDAGDCAGLDLSERHAQSAVFFDVVSRPHGYRVGEAELRLSGESGGELLLVPCARAAPGSDEVVCAE